MRDDDNTSDIVMRDDVDDASLETGGEKLAPLKKARDGHTIVSPASPDLHYDAG